MLSQKVVYCNFQVKLIHLLEMFFLSTCDQSILFVHIKQKGNTVAVDRFHVGHSRENAGVPYDTNYGPVPLKLNRVKMLLLCMLARWKSSATTNGTEP